MKNLYSLLVYFGTCLLMISCLSKPQSMDLALPENKTEIAVKPEDEYRTMTIILGKDKEIISYMGKISNGNAKDLTLGKSLRDEIATRKKQVLEESAEKGKSGKSLTVIIRPSAISSYESLVSVLDEMAISEVETYLIGELLPEEKELLNP
ncbi:MAG: biopolymer transporter ExbD [Flavobacterium sp.]|uniref:ExbD/TolR family protein n=1 Tax=Flavobacterium sp. TaxID=239 RepID=UPI0011F93605|nr:biopolymer transporter ExbD [Flavobacterium sp.]RZJ65185.1 MAG: biopolymer transporter ExbD [Flavobacterium sp.]